MSIEYGRKNCNHNWRHVRYGHFDTCCKIVCIECGALDCACNDDFKKEHKKEKPVDMDANLNGRWKNPYVKEDKPATNEQLLNLACNPDKDIAKQAIMKIVYKKENGEW